jgi:phospholipase C
MRTLLRRALTLTIALLLVAVLVVGAEPVPSAGTFFPIRHVVIIMQENHSFDNYFGTFPGANGFANAPPAAKQKMHTTTAPTFDPCHSVACSQRYYDGGKMDGWTNYEAFGTYSAKSIPFYWKLAENFTLMDNYFAGFLGPSVPNRVVAIAGSNYGGTTSQVNYDGSNLNLTIFDQLNAAGVSWRYYTGYSESFNGFNPLPLTTKHHKATDYQLFESDLAANKLAEVSWVMPQSDELSEHPTYNVTAGMVQVRSPINSVMKSSYWRATAILLTWDEAGGFYDHVVPPNSTAGVPLGFRVPMIIVSPFAQRGFLDHRVSSHLSILAFIETLFRLPCMKSDCGSSDLMEAFAFGHKNLARFNTAIAGSGPSMLLANDPRVPTLGAAPGSETRFQVSGLA